eukprot:361393-Prymnesium_polylepis.2
MEVGHAQTQANWNCRARSNRGKCHCLGGMSPGVGFLAGPELLDFYETAIASPTVSVSVLVSLGLLERATFSILCAHFSLARAARATITHIENTCEMRARNSKIPPRYSADPHSRK